MHPFFWNCNILTVDRNIQLRPYQCRREQRNNFVSGIILLNTSVCLPSLQIVGVMELGSTNEWLWSPDAFQGNTYLITCSSSSVYIVEYSCLLEYLAFSLYWKASCFFQMITSICLFYILICSSRVLAVGLRLVLCWDLFMT